jgi:hypothetical protein
MVYRQSILVYWGSTTNSLITGLILENLTFTLSIS